MLSSPPAAGVTQHEDERHSVTGTRHRPTPDDRAPTPLFKFMGAHFMLVMKNDGPATVFVANTLQIVGKPVVLARKPAVSVVDSVAEQRLIGGTVPFDQLDSQYESGDDAVVQAVHVGGFCRHRCHGGFDAGLFDAAALPDPKGRYNFLAQFNLPELAADVSDVGRKLRMSVDSVSRGSCSLEGRFHPELGRVVEHDRGGPALRVAHGSASTRFSACDARSRYCGQ